jgi:hypothetical protein
MDLLRGHIDLSNIRMMGRWHSDTIMHYFHVKAQPILGNYAAQMFNKETYISLSHETVPFTDTYDDGL